MEGASIAPASTESRIARAQKLACEIENILTAEGAAHDGRGYSVRLAQAMARNLIDQLAEVERATSRPTVPPPPTSRPIVS
jgi:hypothetical protein